MSEWIDARPVVSGHLGQGLHGAAGPHGQAQAARGGPPGHRLLRLWRRPGRGVQPSAVLPGQTDTAALIDSCG